jgi:glutamate dehydrogenase (NAD(P)+)
LDVRGLIEAAKSGGSLATCPDADSIEREAFWDVECDILIPAALEGQITAHRARRIRAKVVLEGHCKLQHWCGGRVLVWVERHR